MWAVLAREGAREVRMSPHGIVVVEDTLSDGTIRHTRVYPDGRHTQVVAATPTKAWVAAARKAAA